jgi:hypothetical protein
MSAIMAFLFINLVPHLLANATEILFNMLLNPKRALDITPKFISIHDFDDIIGAWSRMTAELGYSAVFHKLAN